MDFYKAIWSHVGGRPWTYIARDIYHRLEYLILVSLFIAGYALGYSGITTWKWLMVILSAYTIGYIHGHFFWGSEYIPGQKGN
ncbi:MAG: hypothetical protein JW967_08450 [Dehalococcoidales bacterium]|nr:hypothetical protein [Dehalococcoidales bacterium]